MVVGRSPVGEATAIPRHPAAFLQLDLGIVPSAQESATISNRLQDHVIEMLQKAYPMDKSIDDSSIGVFYHSRYDRGKYVYMVHARSAVMQEIVASALGGHKIPMVEQKLYKAAKEMADINKGLRAFKDDMATVSGAKLSANDRRSLARRFWNTNKEMLCEIADDEVMQQHSLTDWAAASLVQNEQRQQNRTDAKTKCVTEHAARLKASRKVVDYVGTTEMPKWSDDNKESVEAHAIELRHKLAQRLGHRDLYRTP